MPAPMAASVNATSAASRRKKLAAINRLKMPVRMTAANRLVGAHNGERRNYQQREQEDAEEDDDHSAVSPGPDRSLFWLQAGKNRCAGERVRRRRACQQQEQEDGRELDRGERHACLQHDAAEDQHGAHGVCQARRMHARIEVGHAQCAEPADEDKHAARSEQYPAQNVDSHGHESLFASFSSALSPSARSRMNSSTAITPMKVDQRIDQREVKKVRPSVQKSNYGQEQHRLRAEHIGREQSVINRRAQQCAHQRQRHRNERCDCDGVIHG